MGIIAIWQNQLHAKYLISGTKLNMENQSYSDWRKKLHRRAEEKRALLRVMFELTYRCNFACRHCYIPQRYKAPSRRELKTKEVFCILDQLRDVGCFYLGFTGGEPFIREDILDILWYAKRLGFEIIVYTNGSLLTKKKIGELSNIRPNKIDITLPGMSREAFERTSKVAGSRNKVFQAIALLHKAGINLGFKACQLKDNISELSEMRDFAVSMGAPFRFDDLFFPRLDGSREPFKQRASNDEVNGDLAGRIRMGGSEYPGRRPVNRQRLSNKTNSTGKAGALFKCGVGISQAAISPQGELKMCVMIDYPKYKIPVGAQTFGKSSIGKPGLEHIWRKLQRLVKGIAPDKDYQCASCDVSDLCKWCPARSWIMHKSFCRCVPESREWAVLRKQDTRTMNIERSAGCVS